jgi:hypothetical protein
LDKVGKDSPAQRNWGQGDKVWDVHFGSNAGKVCLKQPGSDAVHDERLHRTLELLGCLELFKGSKDELKALTGVVFSDLYEGFGAHRVRRAFLSADPTPVPFAIFAVHENHTVNYCSK